MENKITLASLSCENCFEILTVSNITFRLLGSKQDDEVWLMLAFRLSRFCFCKLFLAPDLVSSCRVVLVLRNKLRTLHHLLIETWDLLGARESDRASMRALQPFRAVSTSSIVFFDNPVALLWCWRCARKARRGAAIGLWRGYGTERTGLRVTEGTDMVLQCPNCQDCTARGRYNAISIFSQAIIPRAF